MSKLAVAGALVLLMVSACTGKDPYNPGTAMGSFDVTGKLVANGCGTAGTAPDPWTFRVKLARDPSTLYWIQGDVPVSGILDARTHAKLLATATTIARKPDAQHGVSGCAIQRDDTVEATLGGLTSEGKVDTFTGSLAYKFSASADSDCSDQVSGGGFTALPCSVAYEIRAVRNPGVK